MSDPVFRSDVISHLVYIDLYSDRDWIQGQWVFSQKDFSRIFSLFRRMEAINYLPFTGRKSCTSS